MRTAIRWTTGTTGTTALATALATALLATGCTASTPTPPEGSPTAPAPPEVVAVEIDAARAITMPSELVPGAYVFEVSSAAESTLTVLEPRGGYAPEDLAADVGPAESFEDHVASWARFEAGTHARGGTWSVPERPASFALTLDAGEYWFVDLQRTITSEPLVDPANVVEVTVAGTPADSVLPDAEHVATVDGERRWRLPETLPTAGTLRVTNPTGGGHQLLLEPVPEGYSPEEWLDMTRRGRGIECGCAGPGRVGGGAEVVWMYDLEPGDYVVLDFSTGPDGAHAYHGAGATLVTLG